MCEIIRVVFIITTIIFVVNSAAKIPSKLDPKIINGTIADPNETKHQVSIHLKILDTYFGSGHICGGSLIKPSIVLTAAHCAYNYGLKQMREASEFIVSMGSIDRYDSQASTVFEVLEIVYKNTFSSSVFTDDIALMILNGSVPTAQENIQTIALNWNIVPDDTVCQVTGWGITEDGDLSDVLLSVDVPIVNHKLCASKYDGFVREGMLCAGYMEGMRDACNGDSGGPLVCNGKLTGLVSFGSICASPNHPGVYTDVRYHSEWLREMTGGVNPLKASIKLLVSSLLFITTMSGILIV